MRTRLLRHFALSVLIALGAGSVAFAAYYDDPRDIDVKGPYTQNASGMVFPETVRGFKRTDVIRYNSEGTDESVSYLQEVGGKKIAVTIYVYPVPFDIGSALAQALPKDDVVGTLYMVSEQLFSDEEQTIRELHPGSVVLNESETSLMQQGMNYPGYVASFRYGEDFFGEVQPVQSQMYLFPMVRGTWMVKYRFTYPDGVDGASQAALFLRAFPWTIREKK